MPGVGVAGIEVIVCLRFMESVSVYLGAFVLVALIGW